MGGIFDFFITWGSNAVVPYYQQFYNALSTGETLPQSFWEATQATFSNLPNTINDVFGNAVLAAVKGLPDGGTFPPQFHEAAIYFGNSLQSVAFFLPVDAMVYCLMLSLNILMALWSFHVVRVGFNFLRGIGTERYSTTETYTESGGRSSFRISTSRHF